MCGPAEIGLTLAIIGTATSIAGQDQQQRQALKYQSAQVQQANEIAKADFQARTQAEQDRLNQEQVAAAQSGLKANVDAASAISTARVASAEAGVQGNSVDALYADYARTNAMFRDTSATNLSWAQKQYGSNVQGIRSSGQNYLSNFNYAPVQGPNYIGGALQIGEGYMKYEDRKANYGKNGYPE